MSALFERITSFDNLHSAARAAARGKRYRASPAAFLMRMESECLRLSEELRTGAWRPGPYRVFEIREPKVRTICAAPFRDRVVHQAIVQVVEPLFERGFIADSYSCRVGKGTHAALDRVERWADEYPWTLKVDVEKYFPSIDHEVALTRLARRISCRRTMDVFARVLGSWTSREAPLSWFAGDALFTPAMRARGLPIGNLTSQFLSNVVLDAVDHEVKDRLRVRAYARYCDDMVVFGRSAEELVCLKKAIGEALAELRLVVNDRKSHVMPTAQGVPWVGFMVRPSRTSARREALARVRRRFRLFARQGGGSAVVSDAVEASIAAWRGHARRGLSKTDLEEFVALAWHRIRPPAPSARPTSNP